MILAAVTAICATAVLAILVDAIMGLRPYIGAIKLKKGKPWSTHR